MQPTQFNAKSIMGFMLTRQVSQLNVHDVNVLRRAECGTNRTNFLFPITRHHVDKRDGEGEGIREPRLNLSGFTDKSATTTYGDTSILA